MSYYKSTVICIVVVVVNNQICVSENKYLCSGAGADNLEDLLSQLGQQINSSDWLKQNTPEKFAAENPEVAKAFQDVADAAKAKTSDKPSS